MLMKDVVGAHLVLWMLCSSISALPEWPSGVYGLPRPKKGCPSSWSRGSRYHNTEDYHSHNVHSQAYHFSGSINEHGIRQEFCIKDKDTPVGAAASATNSGTSNNSNGGGGTSSNNNGTTNGTKEDDDEADVEVLWPDGQYCVYKYGIHCPIGLKEGWIFWDDENNKILDGNNHVDGVVPEGVYEDDTLMYFCCRTTGRTDRPIELPLETPFYLMAYNSTKCQKVTGAHVNLEFIQWDDEDRGNSNAHAKVAPYGVTTNPWNTRIYYCYYIPVVFQNTSVVVSAPSQYKMVDVVNHEVKEENVTKHQVLKKKNHRKSATAVIIGSSVAGVIVGTAATGLVLKHFLRKRGYTETPMYESDEEDVFPMPDNMY